MSRFIVFIASLMLLVSYPACHRYTMNETEIKNNEETFMVTGTVVHVKLEGGFFGIIADNGKRYVPLNLPANYQEDGLEVKFEARFRPDLLGFHMWGTYIEITEITRKEDI